MAPRTNIQTLQENRGKGGLMLSRRLSFIQNRFQYRGAGGVGSKKYSGRRKSILKLKDKESDAQNDILIELHAPVDIY